MKAILLFLSLFIFLSSGFGIELKYDEKLGRKLRFKNQVFFYAYYNGQIFATNDQMNKAILELTALSNNLGVYQGKYYNYERENKVDPSYKLNTVYSGIYYQDKYGRMLVSPRDKIPSTRSIPTFPVSNLSAGDGWTARGEEILENIFDSNKTYSVPVEVDYKFIGIETNEGRALAKILIDYYILHYPVGDKTLYSITGYTHNTFYWDLSNRAPYYYTEDINLLYTARNGETVLFRGNSESRVEEVADITNVEKQNLTKEISNQLVNNVSGVTVRETNDGIIVNFGNILFDIDKFNIKTEYNDKLDNLANILLKYPKLDIAVSGHTDNTGDSPYNTVLSENRAKSVTDYLVKKGVLSSRISYAGYGPTRPLASNATSTGRAQNRRVEVKIITKE